MKTVFSTVMFVLKLWFVFSCLKFAALQENNVCGSYQDYYTMKTNPKCWYDFAAEGTVMDIIQKNGYPYEEHKVTTSDGYILTLFRIPNYKHHEAKDHPVFLQHGLLSDAVSFVGLNNNSLAFILSDAGYDVWLGNYRGTQYSEGHVNMTVYDKKYWDHSIDELGRLDLPAMLNHVSETTGKRRKILYIGYSLGTTMALMYSSTFPESAKNTVKLFLYMAPSYKLTNVISPIRSMAPFTGTILNVVNEYDLIRLLSQASMQQALLRTVCLESPKLMERCMQFIKVICGANTQTGTESIPVILNFAGGSSLKVVKHVMNFMNGKFEMYDYGLKNNQLYGRSSPPIYDIRNINVPVYMMYAVNDWLTSKTDCLNFYYSLPAEVRYGLYEISVPDFNHLDFVTGRHVKELVYNQILKVFDKINAQS